MAQSAASARPVRMGHSSRKTCSTKPRSSVRALDKQRDKISPPSPTSCCWSSARPNPRRQATRIGQGRQRGGLSGRVRRGRRPGPARKRGASGGGHLARECRSRLVCPGTELPSRDIATFSDGQDGAAPPAVTPLAARGQAGLRLPSRCAKPPVATFASQSPPQSELDVLSPGIAPLRGCRHLGHLCTSPSSMAISPISPNRC